MKDKEKVDICIDKNKIEQTNKEFQKSINDVKNREMKSIEYAKNFHCEK